MPEKQAKDEVIRAGKELVERGLVARTWGNVSCRIDADTFAITPSGIAYENLAPENIVVVNINTLEYEGEIKPSSEKGIHAAAYRIDPAVNFVIHTHQTYASCLSVAGFASLNPAPTEAALLGGAVLLADYGLPGTKKLKKNVEKALAAGSTAVLMAKHGALVTGPDREAAFKRAVVLEDMCKRAAHKTPLSDCDPVVVSKRLGGALSEIKKSSGEPVVVDFAANDVIDTTTVEAIHAALYKAYPHFKTIMHLESKIVSSVMESTAVVPALLDDFAQMAGSDLRICPVMPVPGPRGAGGEALARVVRAIKGRNCVCVRELGALCCAADESDCAALVSLVEKNALAYLNARDKGYVPALSWLDKKLMRFVYLTKYSKKK
jgi:L-fuculose-phosphate aldolase